MKKNRQFQSAFLNFRVALGLMLCAAGLVMAFTGFGAFTKSPNPEPPDAVYIAQAAEKVYPAVFNGDVRDLPQIPQKNIDRLPELEPPFDYKQLLPEARMEHAPERNIVTAPMPAPLQNFAGITRTDSCVGGQCGAGTPPDTNGDVGPNHYIQSVNSSFAIYSKTGTLLASFTENSLWS